MPTFPIFTLNLDGHSQSSLGNQSLSLVEASSSEVTECISILDTVDVDLFNAGTVTPQGLSDEANCEHLCSSGQVIDRILNVTVPQEPRTPIPRPSLQQSQTPETLREQRKNELWKFISEYWMGKK